MQQIGLLTHEATILKENLKDYLWVLTKEVVDLSNKIKKPTQEMQYIAENFLVLLKQKETHWKAFQVFHNLKKYFFFCFV